MKLHFLVEGTSEVKFLEGLLPRLIPNHKFAVYPHQGKGKLPNDPQQPPDPKHRGVLDLLPATLRAWGKSLSPETDRVVLLVDLDNDNCTWLLQELSDVLAAIEPAPICLFRLAVEEVEAWYLGDWAALKRAFPKAKRMLWSNYEQDAICGTWEVLQQIIQDPVDRKTSWAEKMGVELEIYEAGGVNRSVSFQKFCSGVRRLAGEVSEGPRARRQRTDLQARTKAKKSSAKR
ncbi:DUF4276 family protein [Sorangium sp. So ce128]|uniref:DUF4276 family protein n=1 Tax=Sorangium sp. So ce128 TaxID=3133281 RepID=UPI003F62D20B